MIPLLPLQARLHHPSRASILFLLLYLLNSYLHPLLISCGFPSQQPLQHITITDQPSLVVVQEHSGTNFLHLLRRFFASIDHLDRRLDRILEAFLLDRDFLAYDSGHNIAGFDVGQRLWSRD
jgi:hypothetical protein